MTVKPQASEAHEALTYDFDDVKPESAVVTLRWEKMAVPFSVGVDTTQTTLQSLRLELRGGKQYNWIGLDEAANNCLQHKTNYEEALHWADLSVQNEERFENLMTKAQLLTALNRAGDAKKANDRAMEVGNATQIYFWGRQLQALKEDAGAIETFRLVSKRFPDHWVGHQAAGAGRFGRRKVLTMPPNTLQLALSSGGVPDQSKSAVEGYLWRVQAKQDFNR